MAEDNQKDGGGQDSAQPAEKPDASKKDDAQQKSVKAKTVKQPLSTRIFGLTRGINIYLIAFIVLVIIAIAVTFIALSTDNTGGPSITGQDLSQEALDELLLNENNIGDVSQTLTVEANAIFNGKILIKDNLDVAGSINVGGPLTLPGITVAGTSAFDDVEVSNNLQILGNASIQGTLTIQSSLAVSGDGSFTGELSAPRIEVDTLEFNGDLQFRRHVDTGGPTPTASAGGAAGAGATATVSGTDTSGTVTINTGSGAANGLLANVTFARAFNGTPQVIITPVNTAGAVINYYVTRTTTGFTIRSTGAPAPSSSSTLTFDYWAAE